MTNDKKTGKSITYDDYLDAEKKRGHIIYQCRMEGCKFRGMGAAVTVHEANHPNHQCIGEDEILNLDKLSQIWTERN